MADQIIIPVSRKAIGRAVQIAVCLALAFVPFTMGAALLHYALNRPNPDIGTLFGSYLFFLLAASFVFTAFMKNDDQ